MSKKAYTKVIQRTEILKEPTPEEFKQDQLERFVQSERIEPRHRFVSVAERLAKSSLYHRNLYLTELTQLGKWDDDLARVEMMFPYCEGGKLYVDEVSDEQELEKSKQKAAILLEAGVRFVILEEDDKLDVALEKLAEVDRVLDNRNKRAQAKTQ